MSAPGLLGPGTWINPGPASLVRRESGWILLPPSAPADLIESAWEQLDRHARAAAERDSSADQRAPAVTEVEAILRALAEDCALPSTAALPALILVLSAGGGIAAAVTGDATLTIHALACPEPITVLAGSADRPALRRVAQVLRLSAGEVPPEIGAGRPRVGEGIVRVRGVVDVLVDPLGLDSSVREQLLEQVRGERERTALPAGARRSSTASRSAASSGAETIRPSGAPASGGPLPPSGSPLPASDGALPALDGSLPASAPAPPESPLQPQCGGTAPPGAAALPGLAGQPRPQIDPAASYALAALFDARTPRAPLRLPRPSPPAPSPARAAVVAAPEAPERPEPHAQRESVAGSGSSQDAGARRSQDAGAGRSQDAGIGQFPSVAAPTAAGAAVDCSEPVRAPQPALAVPEVEDGEQRTKLLMLEMGAGTEEGRSISLARRTILGRRPRLGEEAAVSGALLIDLPGVSAAVSRAHVEIRPEEGRAWARDLGSANGTVLRRAGRLDRALPAGCDAELRAGDELLLGGDVLIGVQGWET